MDEYTKSTLKSLHSACSKGRKEEVADILKDETIAHVLNRRLGHDKKAALHLATENKHVKCVELLLKHPNISVDIEDARKWTSLQIAANQGYDEIVKLLLGCHADIWHHTENENTPCHNAAMHGHTLVVETLLKKDPKLATVKNTHEWTPLHLACVDGYIETVKVLLKFKPDLENKTYLGETPCNLAARNNCVDIIRLLSKNGADLNSPNQNDEAPLHTAAMSGFEETVEYLLKHDVETTAQTKTGMTALHFAAKNGYDKIIMLFCNFAKNFGELIDAKTERGNTLWISTMGCGLHLPEMTPLHLAAIEAKPEAVKILIRCGADRNIKDGNDRTALDLVNSHLHKYQTWDRECVDAVKDTIENWTLANTDGASLANQGDRERHHDYQYADSDYQSSCTTEDIAESVHELEGSVKSFPHATSNTKKARKGLERLLKEQSQLEELIKTSNNISGSEKGKLNSKLQEIEGNIQSLVNLFESRTEKVDTVEETQDESGELPDREELIRRFRSNFTVLQDNLQAEDHMHFLFQEEVLESSEIEQIYSASSEKLKVIKLLYILWGKKDDVWIKIFLKSLEMSESSSHLLSLFKN